MEKKKVAILLRWMKMGGVGKNAIYFMRQILPYCDVTLILNEKTGELLEEIPEDVEVVIDRIRPFREVLADDLHSMNPGYLIKDIAYYLRIKMGRDGIDNFRYLAGRTDAACSERFDCAIAYHGQSPELLINLLDRTDADRKCAWVHGRMSFPDEQCAQMQKYYDRLDGFFFVSEVTRKQFARRIKTHPDRTTVYYNPMDKEEILTRAEEEVPEIFSEDYINLLTVGRLSSEKGQRMIPDIVSILKSKGYRIKWYLIGEGEDEAIIQTKVEKMGLTDSIFLLGTVINPFPYIKNCDIYVQPSFSEGYSTTICEAGLLGKAIVATSCSGGIKIQITDGYDGLLAEASPRRIAEGVEKLIVDTELRKTFEKNILKKRFEKESKLEDFLRIFD